MPRNGNSGYAQMDGCEKIDILISKFSHQKIIILFNFFINTESSTQKDEKCTTQTIWSSYSM